MFQGQNPKKSQKITRNTQNFEDYATFQNFQQDDRAFYAPVYIDSEWAERVESEPRSDCRINQRGGANAEDESATT